MNPTVLDVVFLIGGALLLVSVVGSRASGRLGVPALLVFLIVGMLAGSEGPGGIYFDDVGVTQVMGIVALAYILFAGGLDTEWRVVRKVVKLAAPLATVGVVATALLLMVFVRFAFGFSWLEGFLLGAIVSSTDAAAVFAILRARGIALPEKLRSTLELESGSNDPMAVFLTTAAIRLLQEPGFGAGSLALRFVVQMSLGAVVGYLLGVAAVWLINRVDLDYDGLYPVITLGLVPVIYGGADIIGGNGFLAVYIAGITMGHRVFLHKRKLLRFHDGVAWLMQIAMFLTLGLLVFPSRLLPVAGVSLLAALFLIFVARPVAVLLTLTPLRVPLREQLFLGWVGLRGAVPIVLATFPYFAGIQQANAIFHAVFFIVLTSVLLQGTTIPFMARLLGVAPAQPDTPEHITVREDSDLVTLAVPEQGTAAGRRVVSLGLPMDSRILLIYRGGAFFVPEGRTVIEAGDRLMMFTSKTSFDGVRSIIEEKSGWNRPTRR